MSNFLVALQFGGVFINEFENEENDWSKLIFITDDFKDDIFTAQAVKVVPLY